MTKPVKRYFSAPKQSFFLFGARGTGKSTWLQTHFSDCLYLNLLETDVLRNLGSYPEKLEQIVDAHPEKDTVVIDEIQKAPQLLSVVHNLIESKNKKQYVLTGSSARKLKRSGVDLLAGRAIKKSMHPFMASELKKRFDISEALLNGMVPLVVDAEEPSE
ncbi:MAG: AAA family ATPase, partial [Chitinivibrionales bacterium]|nr:AAA family ATPase [Chitinivibrionales bacterium]